MEKKKMRMEIKKKDESKEKERKDEVGKNWEGNSICFHGIRK